MCTSGARLQLAIAPAGMVWFTAQNGDTVGRLDPRDGALEAAAAVSAPFEELVTWKGFAFRVRPAKPSDRPALAELFAQVSPQDRRFRFLSGVNGN